jgi:hypothetical protein
MIIVEYDSTIQDGYDFSERVRFFVKFFLPGHLFPPYRKGLPAKKMPSEVFG